MVSWDAVSWRVVIIIIIINATYIVLGIRHVSIFGVLGGVLEHHQIEETQETVSKF